MQKRTRKSKTAGLEAAPRVWRLIRRNVQIQERLHPNNSPLATEVAGELIAIENSNAHDFMKYHLARRVVAKIVTRLRRDARANGPVL